MQQNVFVVVSSTCWAPSSVLCAPLLPRLSSYYISFSIFFDLCIVLIVYINSLISITCTVCVSLTVCVCVYQAGLAHSETVGSASKPFGTTNTRLCRNKSPNDGSIICSPAHTHTHTHNVRNQLFHDFIKAKLQFVFSWSCSSVWDPLAGAFFFCLVWFLSRFRYCVV